MKKLPLRSFALVGVLALALLVQAVTFASPPNGSESVPAVFPSDAESLGKILCAQVELDRPGLEEMKKQAAQGQFAKALAAWRDYKVDSLRKADLGGFNWHGDQLNTGRLHVAELLTGRMEEADYLKRMGGNPYAFSDIFGLRGRPDQPIHTDWLAKDAQGNFSSDYMNFYFMIPLSVRYWQSGDAVYLSKWFQIAADFARTQKRAVDALDDKTRRLVPCNWSVSAQTALSQGDRVLATIRSLGVFAKSLPGSGRPAKWDDVYKPVSEPLAASERELIPAVELAQIALSLVRDHPTALLARYQNAGAVPNQRRNGLAAVLFVAVQFPEFTASRELLKNGAAGLNDYLQGAFHLDGGMLEQSFNYNLGDAASLGEMANWLRPALPDLAKLLEERQNHFYRVVASLETPLASLPAMSSYGPQNPPPTWTDPVARGKWLAQQIKKMPATSDPLITQIAGQFADPATQPAPAFTSVAFPYSGYYVQRRDWRWDSPYLFMQGCRPGRGHRNMGHNAIQVTAYGRPLLVSNGVPVYTPAQLPAELRGEIDAINQLLGEQSSLKVNTVMVDGQSQNNNAPVAQKAHSGPIEMRWHNGAQFDFVEGFYDLGYPKPGAVNHRREVIFVRNPGFWIVTDVLTNLDQKEHAFTQIWNFPPCKEGPKDAVNGFKNEQVILDPAARQLHTADPDGPNLWLYHFGASALDYVKHYGEKNPWLGWYAIGFGNLTPAPDVMVHWKSPAHSVLVTVIWPTPNGVSKGIEILNYPLGKDPSQAGLALMLPDGSLLEYQASHDPRLFPMKGMRVEAQGLLTVKSPDGSAHGLALGCKGTPADFEFTRKGNTTSDIIPMQIPQGFHWQETPAGFQPVYSK